LRASKPARKRSNPAEYHQTRMSFPILFLSFPRRALPKPCAKEEKRESGPEFNSGLTWIPACAGMTGKRRNKKTAPRFCGTGYIVWLKTFLDMRRSVLVKELDTTPGQEFAGLGHNFIVEFTADLTNRKINMLRILWAHRRVINTKSSIVHYNNERFLLNDF